jgi:hypothetical protein
MKKKLLTRPVCVMFSSEIYQHIKDITDQQEISLSDYIREAIQQILKSKYKGDRI